MDIFKRVAAALDGETATATKPRPQAPLSLEQKRLHVLLVLLRKHASSIKKQTGQALTLKAIDRIIYLLRENLHYFEKTRLHMLKPTYEQKGQKLARR